MSTITYSDECQVSTRHMVWLQLMLSWALLSLRWELAIQTLKGNYKEMVFLRQCEVELKQQSTFSNQNTEDNFIISLRILSITNISSLLSTSDCTTFAWTSFESTRVCTATRGGVFWLTSFRISRAVCNPNLEGGRSFLRTPEYWLPGGEISQHQGTAIGGIFRGVVVWHWSLVFMYKWNGLWYRFNLGTLARRSQVVESQEETRREREV